jgi:uncharacterized iron-regulated membrane protein
MRLRPFWQFLHRYSGLALAVFLLLIALTGSIIAFDREIDRLLNPGLLQVSPGAQPRPLAEQIVTARQVFPERTLAYIYPPTRADEATVLRFKTPKPNAEGMSCCSGFLWSEVLINPYTGEVTGFRERDGIDFSAAGFLRLMHQIHDNLLLEGTGKTLVGICALVWLLSSLVGLYLWWPGAGKLKLALTVKRNAGNARLIFDLHRSVGFYTLLVMLPIAFSGVYYIFPGPVKSLVSVFSPVSAEAKPRSRPLPDQRINADAAVATARQQFPDAELRTVGLPENHLDSYAITFRQADEVNRNRHGKTTVWVDQYSGQVLRLRNGNSLNGGDTFIAWQTPLHSGSAFGLTGRIIVALSGLACTLLIVTGALIWLRRHRAQSRRQNAAPAGLAPLPPQPRTGSL